MRQGQGSELRHDNAPSVHQKSPCKLSLERLDGGSGHLGKNQVGFQSEAFSEREETILGHFIDELSRLRRLVLCRGRRHYHPSLDQVYVGIPRALQR